MKFQYLFVLSLMGLSFACSKQPTEGNFLTASTETSGLEQVTTIAGSPANAGYPLGTGSGGALRYPSGIAIAANGNIFVADTENHLIRKITSSGFMTTFAGTAGESGSTNGVGTSAKFYGPTGLAIDSVGNIYVADSGNHVIRKITTAGVVSTFAGTVGEAGDTDATGSDARFYGPTDIKVDGSHIYVADSGNCLIRKISTTRVVQTLAGGVDDLGSPCSVTALDLDGSGNVYFSNTGNNVVYKATSAGVVSIFAGVPWTLSGGTTYYAEDGNRTTEARFNFQAQVGIAVDSSGNIYVSDSSNVIRKITGNNVTTFAGDMDGAGFIQDGAGVQAKFNGPSGIAIAGNGNIFVADYYNHVIRKITSAAVVSTFAGLPGYHGSNNSSTTTRFNSPGGVAVDNNGNIYIADILNNLIQKISYSGTTSIVAGKPGTGWTDDCVDGSSTVARFCWPSDIEVDNSTGNLYVADTQCALVRKILPNGTVSTLVLENLDGVQFAPIALALDSSSNLYIASSACIYKKPLNGSGSVFAGDCLDSNDNVVDGNGTDARFSSISGIAVDSGGNIFVTEGTTHTIRKITPSADVTVFAGQANDEGSTDATGTAARFKSPMHLVLDSADNIYVNDSGNYRIRKITAAGEVTTLTGSTNAVLDGALADAKFAALSGIAIDSSGKIYVSDLNAIRKID